MKGSDILLLTAMFVVIFFAFSVAGWCMEVTLKYIQYHRFINRGFLVGPYCPIYGWGAVAVTILVGGVMARKGTVGETFLAGMFVCGALEYFTSWYMEKVFHARWWDYSQKPMNLHGRIWIGNLLLFGAASVVIVKIIVPWLLRWLGRLAPMAVEIMALVIVVVMAADYTVSHVLMNVVKREIDAQEGDSTEEISRKVRELLKTRGIFLRRIQSAYPTAQARSKRLVTQWKAAKAKLEAAEAELRQVQENAAEEAKAKLEEARTQTERKLEETKSQTETRLAAAREETERKLEKAKAENDVRKNAAREKLLAAQLRRKEAGEELRKAEQKLFGRRKEDTEE